MDDDLEEHEQIEPKVYIKGFMQPYLIFCPNGHVMEKEGQGDIEEMTAICHEIICPHYKIRYKVVIPPIGLEKVEH